MQTLETTIVRANEPGSATSDFYLDDLQAVYQRTISNTVATSGSGPLEPSQRISTNSPISVEESSEPSIFFELRASFEPMYIMRSSFGGFGYQTVLMGGGTNVIKSGFQTNQWELTQQYGEVKQALHELADLEEEDDWRIEESVYAAATYYASKLRTGSVPAPQIITHGTKSVVFNWTNGYYDLDLTISSNTVSALLSSPGRIIRRAEYSQNQLSSPIALLYFGNENALALRNQSGSNPIESSSL